MLIVRDGEVQRTQERFLYAPPLPCQNRLTAGVIESTMELVK